MTVSPRLAAWLLIASAAACAGGSAVWESHTYEDFLKGRFEGVALTRDGRLILAPAIETVADTGDAGIWSLAAAQDGTVYFAGGHRGRLWRYRKGGKPEVVWQSPQPEIFALAVDSRGRLFAGTSPNGKIFLVENGKATEYFDPKATYIWSLKVAADGALYAGTGDQGKLYRVTGPAQGEVFYETGQTNVTALGFDPQGRLLAGTEPNGILYRVESKGKAFALYDAALQEIRTIVPGPNGETYVAALGGSQAQKLAQAAISAATATAPAGIVTSSITVTAEANARAQSELEVKPKPEAPKPTATPAPESQQTAAVEIPGMEKAAIYRIAPDGLVETVWSSKEENILDLSLSGGDISFSTDRQGRIYKLSPQLKSALLLETREGETTRLIQVGGETLAATSNSGKLLRLGPSCKTRPLHQPGPRRRHVRPLGPNRLARRGLALLPHPLGQLRPPRHHLERLVRAHPRPRQESDPQPRRPLRPVARRPPAGYRSRRRLTELSASKLQAASAQPAGDAAMDSNAAQTQRSFSLHLLLQRQRDRHRRIGARHQRRHAVPGRPPQRHPAGPDHLAGRRPRQ